MAKVILFLCLITLNVETFSVYNIDWFDSKQILIKNVSDYYNQDFDLIKFIFDVSGNFDIDPLLIASLIKIESGFNENAVSEKNALGYCQITKIANIDTDSSLDRRNKYENIILGVMFLDKTLKRFNGNLDKALSYYNLGNEYINNAKGAKYSKAVQKEYKNLKANVL